MRSTALALIFTALAVVVIASELDYMYYPSVTDNAKQAAPTCIVHANNRPCSERNNTPEQRHNVSSYGLPLLHTRKPDFGGSGSRCYNMQHNSKKPIHDHDSNGCEYISNCPQVPMNALWFLNSDCAAPSAGGRGEFRSIMAFSKPNCDPKGDTFVWDMHKMRTDAGVIRTNPWSGDYCLMFGNAEGKGRLRSFQVLEHSPVGTWVPNPH